MGSNRSRHVCIVDYHSKILIVQKTQDMSADSLILACRVIFFRIWIAKENKFKQFCKNMNKEQATSSLHHSQSNGQNGAFIKLYSKI